MFLCCTFIVQYFSSLATHIPHNKRVVRVYNTVCSVLARFGSLEDSTSLAHVPKSLLDPDLEEVEEEDFYLTQNTHYKNTCN